ncbi:unnamed protein product [Symbiodinium natans]|uniref:Uncharacterized protein n=1 Tax=Symbiodinium natans TaxID=878477 RepID=A0A812I2G3_9DINO|nr:unnamed protein product [Symbiodinium natans]
MAQLQELSGIAGHVLTVDISPQGYAPWAHSDCEQRREDSSLWDRHRASRRIAPILREARRWGCPCRISPSEAVGADCVCAQDDAELVRIVADFAARAQRVFILDDASHFKEDVIRNFEMLAAFVTPGSFYVVSDTRLERLCETVKRLGYPLANGFNPGEKVQCDYYIDNGPFSAVAELFSSSELARKRFFIDRKAEGMILGATPSGWLRAIAEWCLLSHNFLAFFASRVDFAVRRCLLLAAIQDLRLQPDGKTLRISIAGDGKEELVLRTVSESMETWAVEIGRRLERLSAYGHQLMPCVNFAEAKQWSQELDAQTAEQEAELCAQVEEQSLGQRLQAAAALLRSSLLRTQSRVTREAFTELALHARLQALRGLQRRAATARLWRALQTPRRRHVEGCLAAWRSLAGCREGKAPARGRRRRSSQEDLRKASTMLEHICREHQEEAMHSFFLQCGRLKTASLREASYSFPTPYAAGPREVNLELSDHCMKAAVNARVASLVLALAEARRRRLLWARLRWAQGAAASRQVFAPPPR